MMFFVSGLILIGLVLVFLEFFLPGGMALLGGVLFLLGGGVVFFSEHPTTREILLFLTGVGISLIATCQLAFWQVKLSAKKKTFCLADDQEGYKASHYDETLIGKTGIAVTDLKPSGHVLIGETFCQAIAERGYISEKSKIRVIGGQGSYLKVYRE